MGQTRVVMNFWPVHEQHVLDLTFDSLSHSPISAQGHCKMAIPNEKLQSVRPLHSSCP